MPDCNCNALISIVIPVYGVEAYLPACIDSVRNQTYKNLQIILVDDESPDKCPQICDDYARKDDRIIVIHQKNKGVSGARNTGINSATGDFIMFVDSDDELYSDAVEILLNDVEEYGADIVWAPQKSGSGSCEEGKYIVYQEDDALLLSLNGTYNINAVWGKLFRRSFIKNILFEIGKNINEDGFFMFQCYMRKPMMVQHNVPVYKYNIRDNSCSRQRFSDKYLSMLYFCERKKELIATDYPQYIEYAYNMEVRTTLQFLDVLCSSTDKKHKKIQNQCVKVIRDLYKYHKPINSHHKKLAWIVSHGLYPLYKVAVRLKYHR
ncbi:MAG: glycosyltransferase family 2 protein [Clostridia bacterium]|nr:glycosyltransferase family 2 protein [Clostridia bacterium]